MKKLILPITILAFLVFNASAVVDIYDDYIVGPNETISDSVHVHPGGRIYNLNSSAYALTITGGLLNEGSIINNPDGHYSLDLNLNGTVINTGVIDCYRVRLQGSTPQKITSTGTFSPSYIDVNNSSGLVAIGDIGFSDTGVNCNNNSLDLTDGSDLNFSGNASYINQLVINGVAASEINLSGNAYLSYVEINGCTITGTLQVASGVKLLGNTVNNGIIQNYGSTNYNLVIEDNFINNGSVQNNSLFRLDVDVYGDITSYGTWSNYAIDLRGTAPQTLKLYDGASIAPAYLTNFNTNSIIAGTDLLFENCIMDLNSNGFIDLTNGNDLYISGQYLTETEIRGLQGSSELNLFNNAKIMYADLYDMTLSGTTNIGNDAVNLYGTTVNNGILQNNNNYPYDVHIYGDFTNNGSVTNNIDGYYNFTVYFYGTNMINNGIWDVDYTDLRGTSDQYISCLNSKPFKSYYFDSYCAGNVVAQTDLYFVDSRIDLNDSNYIDLTAGHNFYIDGGYITRGMIKGLPGSSELSGQGSSYIENLDLYDMTFADTVSIDDSAVHLYGTTVNNGILQNNTSSSYDLHIHDTFTNNGSVTKNIEGYHSLTVYFYGTDLVNNGTWYTYSTRLNGTSDQNISCLNSKPFTGDYFDSYCAGNVVAQTNLYFENNAINLHDSNFVDLTGGFDFTLKNGYMTSGMIKGLAGVSELSGHGSAYIENMDLYDLTFVDTVSIDDDAVNLYGTTVNNGLLRNNSSSSYRINIYDTFTNNGKINPNSLGYSIYINFFGTDLVNNGDWNTYYFDVKSPGDLNVSCLNSKYFQSYYFDNYSGGNLIAQTDLLFRDTRLTLHDSNYVDLTNGYDLKVSGGYMTWGMIKGLGGESELSMGRGAYIENMELYDINFNDTIAVDDDAVHVYGPCTNYGVLSNNNSSTYTMSFHDDLANNGVISNGVYGNYSFKLNVPGNIVNYGTWNNYETNLNGTTDQTVSMMNDNFINCFYFDITSEITGSSYQWFYEGEELNSPDIYGEEASQMYFYNTAVDSAWTGTYYCWVNGDTASRNIIIENIAYESPVITSIVNNGSNVTINWNDIPEADTYKVYSSEDPYAQNYNWVLETEVGTNSAVMPAPDNKRFYMVKAVYIQAKQ